MYIDTHSHIYLPEFDEDRKEVVERALNLNVSKIVLPNVDSTTIEPMNNLVDEFPESCFPLIGLHPTSVKHDYKTQLQLIEQELPKRTYYGIGEIGIDLYWDKTYKKEQMLAFANQIEIANANNLPIVIHARNSLNEIFEVLADFEQQMPCGIFHCFPGNFQQAEKAIQYGFHIGIGGIVTFKNAGLDKLVEKLPLHRIVLETDSPYLAPVPYRGKRNESAYIQIIAKKIAEIKRVPLSEVEVITTQNAQQVFALPHSN